MDPMEGYGADDAPAAVRLHPARVPVEARTAPTGATCSRRGEDGEPERVVVLGDARGQRAGRSRRRSGRRSGVWLPRRLRERHAACPPDRSPRPWPRPASTVIDPVSLSAESQARAWLAELDREREVGAAVAVAQPRHPRAPHRRRRPLRARGLPRPGARDPGRLGRGRAGRRRSLAARARAAVARRPRRAQAAAARRGPGRDRSGRCARRSASRRCSAARGAALLCEELALRARLGPRPRPPCARRARARPRARAGAARAARRAAARICAIRVAELEQLQPGVHAQAQLALAGDDAAPDDADGDQPPASSTMTSSRTRSERLEAALRARTAAGSSGAAVTA